MGFSVVEAYVGSLRVGFSFGRDFLLRKHLSVRNILRPTQLLTHFKYRQCSAPYLSTSSPPPHLTLTSVPFHSTSPPLQLLHLPSQLLHLSMSQSKGGDHPLGWNVDKPIIHNTLHTDCQFHIYTYLLLHSAHHVLQQYSMSVTRNILKTTYPEMVLYGSILCR